MEKSSLIPALRSKNLADILTEFFFSLHHLDARIDMVFNRNVLSTSSVEATVRLERQVWQKAVTETADQAR